MSGWLLSLLPPPLCDPLCLSWASLNQWRSNASSPAAHNKQITTVEEKHQEAAEAAAEQKAGRKRGRGAGGAGPAKKAKPDLAALTQVGDAWMGGCCRGPLPCAAAPGAGGCAWARPGVLLGLARRLLKLAARGTSHPLLHHLAACSASP